MPWQFEGSINVIISLGFSFIGFLVTNLLFKNTILYIYYLDFLFVFCD
jgi:hypothetical protein